MAGGCACPERYDLERLVLGDIADTEMELLEGHVSGCTVCLDVIRALRSEDALVAAVRAGGKVGRLPAEEIDAALIDRLCRLVPPVRGALPADAATSPESVEGLSGLLEPAAEPDELGRIGPYGILRVLGSGGMGVVCAARQSRPRRVVALKMLLTDPRAGQHRLARFQSESEILARLRHPNIVQVHEVGVHGGRAYFTMEYAEGGSLAQKLAVAPLSACEAAELTRTLARTIAAAHEQGIVHRDLKPSNILLVSGPVASGGVTAHHSPLTTHRSLLATHQPKIGDFGLAKQMDGEAPTERTESGAILGTPGYMAPEQAAGCSRDIGPAADVYALGAVLYECLTGRPPFKAATMLETLEQVRTQDPVPPGRLQPMLPRDLQTICLKCLVKEPRRRYASAVALAEDLDRFLEGKPITARPIGVWERTCKWARRRPALAALLVVSVLSVAALTVGVLVHDAQLQQAVDQAQANATEARRQQEQARGHYQRARDTLEKMLQQFKDLRLGEVPQLKELQRRQLEDAVAFYQGALNDQDDPDPAVRVDVALACKRAGDLQGLLGRQAEAAKNYEQAIGLLVALPAEEYNEQANQRLLAVCYNHHGLVARGIHGSDAAERDYRKALAIFEAMAAKSPGNTQWREGIAETEHYLGAMLQGSDNVADAEPHHRRAASLYAELVHDRPENDGYLARLADIEINLALLYQLEAKRKAEATGLYEQAEGRLRLLRERHPMTGEYALSLAALYSNWGHHLRGAGEPEAALVKLDRAVELAEGVVKNEPHHWFARYVTFNAHGARLQLFESQGRWADVVKDWDRVVELDDRPDGWGRRVLRALAVARTGQHARAAAEVQILAKDSKVSAEGRYTLACACAVSAEKAASDTALDGGKQKALAEQYAARAVQFLRQAQAQGYFKDAAQAKTLATDSDLNVLRKRADFQQLLMETKGSNQ